MTLYELQTKVSEINQKKGYTTDLVTLTLGVCEEAGELAKAVNMQNRLYIPKSGVKSHSIEEEIIDLLVYLVSVANAAGIDLEILLEKRLIIE